MTLTDVLYILLGGGIVCCGVLAVATADRIRGNTIGVRRSAGKTRLAIATVHSPTPMGIDPMSRERLLRSDVIKALSQAGYTHRDARNAADACALSERATLECWTRAALKKAIAS